MPVPSPTDDVHQRQENHCQEFIKLHVITKNAQSIREPSRFDDFLVEIDTCDFDILCICKTWRGDDSESWTWTTTSGHKLFFSGCSTHCGVGIGIGRKLALEMSHVHLWFTSERFYVQFCRAHFGL